MVVAGVGVAFAQEQGDVELRFRQRAQLSAEQQLAEAERIVAQGRSAQRVVMRLLDDARRERDVIKITCLNDKLTQLNVNLRTAEDRQDALRQAAQSGDTEARNHQFTILDVLKEKMDTLLLEARQCTGAELDVFTAGELKVDVDPEIPEEDPSQFQDTPFLTDRPVNASGYY
jgi:hypothetical protein